MHCDSSCVFNFPSAYINGTVLAETFKCLYISNSRLKGCVSLRFIGIEYRVPCVLLAEKLTPRWPIVFGRTELDAKFLGEPSMRRKFTFGLGLLGLCGVVRYEVLERME